MKKKRVSMKYGQFWIDEQGFIHICSFLTCNDGCNCEKASMTLDFLEGAVKKIKEVKTR